MHWLYTGTFRVIGSSPAHLQMAKFFSRQSFFFVICVVQKSAGETCHTEKSLNL
jgi:hypothetical protein